MLLLLLKSNRIKDLKNIEHDETAFNIFSSTSVHFDLVVADHVTKWFSWGGVPPTSRYTSLQKSITRSFTEQAD